MRSWDLVRVFLALHRAGSYEGASQALNMDISTVRRKIQALESNLGMALFLRDVRGITLRPGQEELIAAAMEMEVSAERFQHQSQGAQRGGIVRLTMLDLFASMLIDKLEALRSESPEIILDITTETYFVDLESEGVDIAVRLARPTRGTAGMRKIAEVPFARYVAESKLDHFKAPGARGVEIVSLASDFWHRDHEFKLVDERRGELRNVVARVDSYPLLLQLCEAGTGVALLPCFLARSRPGLARLDADTITADLWLIVRRDQSRAWRTRRTIEFLVQTFGALDKSVLNVR
ncbi:LysR family transcriptional regulator [Bradyrhizobium quebecense]|uniref:LysR family transcriptional regulator n=2 Tax=Bradyrhizobium quebecense TaxID=2748629 RepID=A0ABS3MTA4_9BRAD|nr:LysR family transcriptional regulator [Bradyrhizobium quebecense]UGY02513.1 LysR family transcriptional regulator [Bradyrhizobium quebecense]